MAIRLPKIFLFISIVVSFLVLALADRALGIGRLPELAMAERIAAAADGRQVARLGLLEQRRWKELDRLRADVDASQRDLEARIVHAVRSGMASSTAPLTERIEALSRDYRRLVTATIISLLAVAILSYRVGRLATRRAPDSGSSAALIELAALESTVTRLRVDRDERRPRARSTAPLRKVG